jgi:hypothetical protein
MKNNNLTKAKKEKNDEFYTLLSDIEKELKHYKEHFKDKVVFLNCDDPQESNFWKYFELNFEFLGLKKLISTHYEKDKPSYKLEIIGDKNLDGKINSKDIIRTELKQNGDFRSEESVAILKECDVVVTNPPFSLFREFVSLLVEYNKKFLVVGSMNAITYKDCFALIRDNKMWLGLNGIKEFVKPCGSTQKFGNILWFTNLVHSKRNEKLILYKEYNAQDYPKYDNYNAINVDKTKDIPCDYYGVVGVPISFLSVFNPEQFEIVNCNDFKKEGVKDKPHGLIKDAEGKIGDRTVYGRILIKSK